MVSKEEYLKYVRDLVNKDKTNKNLKYLSKGYKTGSGLLLTGGIISFFIGFFLVTNPFLDNAIGSILMLLGIVCCFVGVVMLTRSNKTKKYYKDNYREKVIAYLLKDNDWAFNENEWISQSVFKDSQFGGYYEDYVGSDKLAVNIPNDDGSRSKNYLNLCDLDVTKTETDSDGNSETVTVYRGVFGYIDFPFEFKCILCLNTNYRKSGVKLEKVNLEDINFNKKFKIYSENQIESRYILTPDIMEKLLFLNSKLNGVKITLVDNKMYIGFPSKNLFELNGLKNDNIESMFETFYDEIDVILKIVKEIKTNNKIFKI